MELLKLAFNCNVIRKTDDGFTAVLPEEESYIVKFRDSQYSHFFDAGDKLTISIENVEENGKEFVKKDYSIIYIVLNSFISNGFLFRDITNKKKFFWDSRGMITHKKFEREDIFNENDLLKIVIKKI